MNSEQFHEAVIDTVKQAFMKWDDRTNPLEWSELPSALQALMNTAIGEAIEATRGTDSIYGAPFWVDSGEWSADFRTHTPNPDALIRVAINPLDDDEWVETEPFNLADAVIREALGEGTGWKVGVVIRQLEGTIAKLKREAAARGWDLEK